MLEIHNFTTNKIDDDFLKKIAELSLETAFNSGEFSNLSKKCKVEISLAIVGDDRMRKLNKLYRGKNRVTDVLSFGDKSVMDYLVNVTAPKKERISKQGFVEAPDGICRLGEIVICYSRAKKQAKEANHPLEKEIAFLLIHGILHLLRYDHEADEKDAEDMREMEKKILLKI
ncbi:MAG: rRNA maturation RNase YbeY [bacterium]